MRVKDLKKLLEEKFQDDDLILMNGYNDEGNEYYEAEKDEIIDQDYFKEINSHEKSYFLGLLFADGCIGFSYRNTKDKPRKIFYFNIVSSKEFLASIRDIFINQLNLKENKLVKKHKQDNNIYSLSYSSKNDIIKIRDFLYKDSLLFLNRKKVIFYSM